MEKKVFDIIKSQIGDIKLPSNVMVCECPVHGQYLAIKDDNGEYCCPYCKVYMDTDTNDKGNGTTASELEHVINVRDTMRGLLGMN